MKTVLITALATLVLISFTMSCSNTSDFQSKDRGGGVEIGSAEDRKAIESAYDNWYSAWETKSSQLAAQDYSDDAFWVNAFGARRTGRAEIEDTLSQVFALDFVMAGKSRTVEKTIRFLKPDVALVESRVQREGQKTGSGEDLGTRNTTHLRVFFKSDGKWQIVSHLISDARSTESREH